ncbi:MAG: sulfatase-like hydrolase/transferase [Sphingopyxis sp.]|uniref:sulfatase-like hydrolase/transferase n=1 Tax=Sphingopyxis sp. TaxID=1908224 RepID=UPI002ABA8D48|nr:sulfatase-like hydrolase/transferase [Sphingopyxis sp.]MDZ3831485.1 sulfatase-like hydrolase/transferase [Sphingopyxis sp.]
MLIKSALVGVALILDLPAIGDRIAMLGLTPPLILFFGLYALLALALWGSAFIRPSALRWGWALILSGGAMVVGSYQTASADVMSYDAFVTMMLSVGFADDALRQYGAAIGWTLAGTLPLLLGIGIRPGTRPRLPGAVTILAPMAGLLLLSLLLFARGGEGGRGLPNAWVGSAYSALFAYEAATLPALSRQPVAIARTRPAAYRDIVLIIDESIAGRYLDINDPDGVRSGLTAAPRDVSIANFGLSASITHCSFGSNMTLRHGGTRDAYQHINAVMPSIFAYAKKAGYATLYIDAQRTGGAYQNGMDDRERRSIDNFIQFDDTPVVDRDMAAATALAAALNNDRREFILINKMGAHFPVADKYPDAAMAYRPALPRNRSANVTEMQLPENLYSGAESWRLYRNAYRNTVGWTVGGFFDRLFAHARLDGALVIYTSDHGQNLHERGDAGTTTHCSAAPASEEGAVPLVIIDAPGRWDAAAKRHFDRSSQYRIFPTLLDAMGYDPASVRATYGHALDADSADPNSFNALFNARLGRAPHWVAVRRGDIARPPPTDQAAAP